MPTQDEARQLASYPSHRETSLLVARYRSVRETADANEIRRSRSGDALSTRVLQAAD